VDQALVTYLRDTAAIAALVGTRIEWGLRPQGSALPALGLTVVSRVPVDSDEGQSTLSASRVQVDCWASNMTGAKALAAALKTALAGPSLALAASTFHGLWTENETDYPSELDKGGATIARVSIDLLINHIE